MLKKKLPLDIVMNKKNIYLCQVVSSEFRNIPNSEFLVQAEVNQEIENWIQKQFVREI